MFIKIIFMLKLNYITWWVAYLLAELFRWKIFGNYAMNVGWKFEGLLFRITLRSLGRGKDIKLHFEKKYFLKIKIAMRKPDLWREKSKKWLIQANKKSSKYGELKWRDMYRNTKIRNVAN